MSQVGCDQSAGGTYLPGLPGWGANTTVLSEEPGEARAAWKHGQDAAGEAEVPPHMLVPGQETTLSRTDGGHPGLWYRVLSMRVQLLSTDWKVTALLETAMRSMKLYILGNACCTGRRKTMSSS